MAGMRICSVCGKDFYDNSVNHSKVTCSNKCRDALIYQDPDKKLNRSIQMRLRLMKANFDKETIERIKADLRIGKCAICERERKEDEKDFHIDHDHVTGEYRGILCPQCNYALGDIYDSPLHAILLCKYLLAKKSRGIDWTDSFWLTVFEKQLNSVVSLLETA